MDRFNITDLSPEAQQQFMDEYVWPRVEAMLPGEVTPSTTFPIGARVRIVGTDSPYDGTYGTVYAYLPGRPCPWHVRPDGRSEEEAGIAFKTEELEPITGMHVPLSEYLTS